MVTSNRTNTLTIALAFASFILLGMAAGLLGVAWPSIQREFGLGPEDAATLLLVSTIGYLSASFASGPLAYRTGAGRMFIFGGGLLVAGMGTFVFGTSWLMLIAAALISGLGSGMVDAGMNAYVAAHHSTRAMNWLHAFFGIGVTIAPLIETEAVRGGAWRGGYGAVGVVAIVITGCLILMVNRWRDIIVDPTTQKRGVSALKTLRMPQVWLGIFMFVLIAGIEATPGQWTFSLFTESRGMDTETAGFWVSIYWGSFTIGRMLFGTYLPKISNANLLRIGIAAAAVGALLMWWNPVMGVGLAGLVLLGFAQAPLFPVAISETPRYLGVAHSQNAIGFQVAGAGIGVAALPGIVGILASSLGGFEVLSPFVFGSLILLFVLHEARVAYSIRSPLVREPYMAGD